MNFQNADMHIQGPQINQFNNIAPKPVPRSLFKRDCTRRSTFNANDLVPVYVDEILPGDDFNVEMTALTRMSTPIKPLMDNLYLESFWFFVPMRLVWSNWQKFQGMQVNPGDSTTFTIPVLDKTVAPMSTTGFVNQSIFDYLGLPTQVTGLDSISALFNRAYDLIWNEWFRDENLQNSLTIATGDGPDNPGNYALRQRNKRKDYLTSCTPWPQKGAEVTVNIGGTAPVKTDATGAASPGTNAYLTIKDATGTARNMTPTGSGGTDSIYAKSGAAATGSWPMYIDLGVANPISINTLRQASLYQQILELDARGGTRYVESIFARFGVVSPDFRLQRPELIGQGSTRINIYAVPQTGATGATGTPQGNLAAFGTSQITGGHGCRYAATEHGILLGMVNVRADLTYQQKVPKMFTRSTRLDFYEPLLNGLGEQAVLNREIYAQGNSFDTNVFGYQERFSEYRYKDSEITGKFRSNDAATLQVWHLSQSFGALPALNSSFITESVPMTRVLAVNTEPAFLFDGFFSANYARPMPIRSNPGIDRL